MARILIFGGAASVAVAAALACAGSLSAAGSAPSGKAVFASQCSACHSVTEHGGTTIGPRLFGVVGRKAGTVPGFHYSSAMRNSGIVWTPDNLDRYIANPKEVVPGDLMPYAGLKDEMKRDALVAYLKTLK